MAYWVFTPNLTPFPSVHDWIYYDRGHSFVENYLGQFKNPLESLDLLWASQNNQIYVQVEN